MHRLVFDYHRGAILGALIGDRIGSSIGYSDAPLPLEMEDLNVFFAEGGHSFQTESTMSAAASLLDMGELDHFDQIARLAEWFSVQDPEERQRILVEEPTTTIALLEHIQCGSYWGLPNLEKKLSVDGNGGLCRAGVTAIAYAEHLENALAKADDACGITHAALNAKAAARVVAWLVCQAVSGRSKKAILRGLWRSDQIKQDLQRLKLEERLVDYLRTGWPAPPLASPTLALAAVLCALQSTDSFEDGLLYVASLGGDLDGNCAVYGLIAGSVYGDGAIPEQWWQGLGLREQAVETADRLHQMSLERLVRSEEALRRRADRFAQRRTALSPLVGASVGWAA